MLVEIQQLVLIQEDKDLTHKNVFDKEKKDAVDIAKYKEVFKME